MTISRTTTALALVVGAALGTGSGQASLGSPTTVAASDPTHFQHPRDNPFYPLTPGLVTRLRGSDEDGSYRETVTVTDQTRMVAGVETTVVHDVVRRADGSLAERTDDWYAADDTGQVWYFGEDTATYDEAGHLIDRDGSWEAGVDGAQPGVIMPVDPQPSDADRMEFQKGVAEDQSWVVQRLPAVRTKGGRYEGIVRTFEWSRLEPDVISMKFYARGLGIVEERDVAGGDEHFWLVSHHR